MKVRETMRTLEDLGSAQTRKTYSRHGVGGKQFGVSYADLGKLKKRIGVDHPLAEQLWRTRNHDARVLSTMIADADGVRSSTLDGWAKELDSYVITNAFSSLVARRIGTVEVDHGETGCKTPKAVAYIDKMWKHKEVMESRRVAREAKKARA